jgi:NitT/TauT family transport system ATP-binding protein
MQVVELQNVGMVYRSKGEVIAALANVSLTVEPGEFVSIIGPSGCGKSTVLRLVADILKPTSGRVQVGGLDPTEARLGRRYSFMFQEPALLPWRKLRDNIGLLLELAHVSAAERQSTVNKLLRTVQLDGFGDRLPRELSGGMRMRAALARALTQNPPLLVMDEPFGALDEITRAQMNRELLRVLSETNAAVLFVTHSIEEAVFLSDRVVVMSARPGRVREIFDIDLQRPRDYDALVEDGAFQIHCRQVRKALRDA